MPDYDRTMNIAGFDIGTCTSACAKWAITEKGAPKILKNIGGTGLYPSMVAFDDDGKPIIGADAMNQLSIRPKLVAQHAKKRIGSGFCYSLGNKYLQPAEVQGYIAKKIYDDLLVSENWPKESIIMGFTYPNMFSAEQIQEYIDGLKKVGLDVDPDFFFSEALAAMTTVANLAHTDMNMKAVLIIDVGGGTTDVLVATAVKENGRMMVKTRAIDGNQSLGGVDWDAVVKEPILDAICQTYGGNITPIQIESDAARRVQIDVKAEEVKIRSCNAAPEDAVEVTTGIFLPGNKLPIDIVINHEWFITSTHPLVAKVVDVVDSVLNRAFNDASENLEKLKLDAISDDSDIDYVIMIGGGSKVPQIREELAKRHPVLADRIVDTTIVNPQFAVAIGAAYLVNQTLKQKTLEEMRLVDRPVVPDPIPQVVSRCKQAYGLSARDVSDNVVKCFIHLYEDDMIPDHLTREYMVPENHASTLAWSVLAIEGWKRENGRSCDLMATKNIGEFSIPCPEDAKGGEKIIVDVGIRQNETIDVNVNFRGETYSGNFQINGA